MKVYSTNDTGAGPAVNTGELDGRGLIKWLHREGSFAYFWRKSDKASFYYTVGNLGQLPVGSDVYFGVHPVRTRRRVDERGRIEDVAAINCLFAEFDAKDFGGDKDTALEVVGQRAALYPTVVVDSGGGWHCYWLLREPKILYNDADRKAAAQLQARLVHAMGADKGAKDLARVLRVPGTTNAKYNPPRPVAITEVWLDSSVFTLDQLQAWLDTVAPAEIGPKANGPVIQSKKEVHPGIAGILSHLAAQNSGGGNRNNSAYWAAKRLSDRGIPVGDAESLITPIGLAIGLPEHEILRTIRSAYRGVR